MMISSAKTVEQYLAGLPEDRRFAIGAVRDTILKNLPQGFQETMQYGMISYVVPHSIYTVGYHCDPKQPLPFAAIVSQKNHMAIYLMTVYGDKGMEKWFRKAYLAAGKKLDMGKSCVRFRKVEDLPLDVIGEAIARVPVRDYIAVCEKALKGRGSRAKA